MMHWLTAASQQCLPACLPARTRACPSACLPACLYPCQSCCTCTQVAYLTAVLVFASSGDWIRASNTAFQVVSESHELVSKEATATLACSPPAPIASISSGPASSPWLHILAEKVCTRKGQG